jgi:hypothetical protein
VSPVSRNVLGMRVDATSYEDASRRVVQWAGEERSTYVCVASVHMVMEAFDSGAFRQVVNAASLVTPDGRPLVWALKALGVERASQVRGTDLTTHVIERAAHEHIPIGLYGGTPELLETFMRVLKAHYPGIRVVCQIAPPFRPLTRDFGVRGTHLIRRYRLSQAGKVDGGAQRACACGHDRGRSSRRFPYGPGAPSTALDASGRLGVGVQADDGSPAVVETLRQAQPEVCRAVLTPAVRSALVR